MALFMASRRSSAAPRQVSGLQRTVLAWDHSPVEPQRWALHPPRRLHQRWLRGPPSTPASRCSLAHTAPQPAAAMGSRDCNWQVLQHLALYPCTHSSPTCSSNGKTPKDRKLSWRVVQHHGVSSHPQLPLLPAHCRCHSGPWQSCGRAGAHCAAADPKPLWPAG